MSLTSSRVGLKHRVTVQRNAGGTTDDWGNPSADAWADYLIDLPCRAWTNAAKEPVDDTTSVVTEDRRLSVAPGADITETDRVRSVTDANGSEIFEGPMDIEGVLRYPDHLELVLERIR